MLTLPAAGVFGAVAYAIASAFGSGVLGPLLMTVVALGALTTMLTARRRRLAEAEAV